MTRLLRRIAMVLCLVVFVVAPCRAVSERASPVGTAESSSAGKHLTSSLGGHLERVAIGPERRASQDPMLGGDAGWPERPDGAAAGLRQNFPNPFNPMTTVSYVLEVPSRVVLAVYDVSGRTVSTLADDPYQEAGPHSILWRGEGRDGMPLPSGVYFLRLVTEQFEQTRKMVLLR